MRSSSRLEVQATRVPAPKDGVGYLARGPVIFFRLPQFSTRAESVAQARNQASRVMNYLIKIRYQLPDVVGVPISDKRGPDLRHEAGFLSHMADAITGENFFFRAHNVISLGTINKNAIVNALTNAVNATLAVATDGLSLGWMKLFNQDPIRNALKQLTADIPDRDIPVLVPVSVTHTLLLKLTDLAAPLVQLDFTGAIGLNTLISSDINDILNKISFKVPTGFSSGSQKVVWQGLKSHIEITPPSITFSDPISLLGLLGKISLRIDSVTGSGVLFAFGWVGAAADVALTVIGKHRPSPFARDLALNQLAFDPDFSSGQFQDLAMADANQSIPGIQPDVWEALLRPAVQRENPAPEVKQAADDIAASAPVTGMSAVAANHWDTKNRWETAAEVDTDNATTRFNGADFLGRVDNTWGVWGH